MTVTDCLYVIEIGDRLKVGRSDSPMRRLATHRSTAAAHGLTTGREWISEPGVGTRQNETVLLRRCAEVEGAQLIAREYFTGLPFGTAVAVASDLQPDDRPQPDGVTALLGHLWGADSLLFKSYQASARGDSKTSQQLLQQHLGA